jgi:hypothetical protein
LFRTKFKQYECCTCASQFKRKLSNDHLTDISLQLSPFDKRYGFQLLNHDQRHVSFTMSFKITSNAWAFGYFIFSQITLLDRAQYCSSSDRSWKLTLFLSFFFFFFFFRGVSTSLPVPWVCIGDMHRCDILEYSFTETSFFPDNSFCGISFPIYSVYAFDDNSHRFAKGKHALRYLLRYKSYWSITSSKL